MEKATWLRRARRVERDVVRLSVLQLTRTDERAVPANIEQHRAPARAFAKQGNRDLRISIVLGGQKQVPVKRTITDKELHSRTLRNVVLVNRVPHPEHVSVQPVLNAIRSVLPAQVQRSATRVPFCDQGVEKAHPIDPTIGVDSRAISGEDQPQVPSEIEARQVEKHRLEVRRAEHRQRRGEHLD